MLEILNKQGGDACSTAIKPEVLVACFVRFRLELKNMEYSQKAEDDKLKNAKRKELEKKIDELQGPSSGSGKSSAQPSKKSRK
jgi:hypothetical protein